MPRRNASCSTVAVLVFTLLAAAAPTSRAEESSGWWHLGAAGAAWLRPELALHALVRTGRMDGLRWPDFSRYRPEVEAFYSLSQYKPAWLREGQPTRQAREMIAILQQAEAEGLRAEDYDSYRWLERLMVLQRPHEVADELRFDLALTVCATRYVSDLRNGRTNPGEFHFGLESGEKKFDLPGFIYQRLASGANLQSEIVKMEPPFAGYRELRQALAEYTRLATEDDGERLPMAQGFGYPGPPYAGYSRLVRLLRRLGDLPRSYVAHPATSAYDASLLQAVRSFQERHGLHVTGYLDADTVEELNVPIEQRVQQIRLAMERYRWLHYDERQAAIIVNIPGFDLYAFDDDGEIGLTMKVDVGDDELDNRTPVLQASMQYLVFRPYWDVPLPIQREEFVPYLEKHPGFLPLHGFQVLARGGKIVRGSGNAEVLVGLRSGALRLRQRPGPDNPLGLVKFMFPNRYAVYLHDVPAWDYGFVLPQRLVSHGCVHVEKPAELAAWLLRHQPGWTEQRVREAMEKGRNNVTVKLTKPVPVLILYSTVAPGTDGDIHFYRDIYGYDAELSRALARGYPYPD